MNKTTQEPKLSIEPWLDISNGIHCGLLIRKRLAKRLINIHAKYQQEMKQIIAANLDEVEPSGWTMSTPMDGKETVYVYFFTGEATDEDKLRRVELLKLGRVKRHKHILENCTHEQATKWAEEEAIRRMCAEDFDTEQEND